MGPKEYTLDDFYALPLDKLDRFVTLKPCGIELPKEGDILAGRLSRERQRPLLWVHQNRQHTGMRRLERVRQQGMSGSGTPV